MAYRKLFDVQEIARLSYDWRANKTWINITLSATIIFVLLGLFAFL